MRLVFANTVRGLRWWQAVRFRYPGEGSASKAQSICRPAGTKAIITQIGLVAALFGIPGSCSRPMSYDVVLRNGRVCDGSGATCVQGGLAIVGDLIAKVGDVAGSRGRTDIDVHGQVIAPGFINMMSAEWGLFADGRARSDTYQGVTLEIFGEGESMGPLNQNMQAEYRDSEAEPYYEVTWHSLAGGLNELARHGVSTNIASFVGTATARINFLGRAKRQPTGDELEQMQLLVANAMEDGALGISSILNYTPDGYASTGELIALAKTAARYKGIYMTSLRDEGDNEMKSIDEIVKISQAADIPVEIVSFKVAGNRNWENIDQIVQKIEDARAHGLKITANMYTYTASATGLDATMPPWVQEGGIDALRKRLQNPVIRDRVRREMRTPRRTWDNRLLAVGSPDRIKLIAFKNEKLRPLTGKTLGDVALMRHTSAEDAAMDLIIEDGSPVNALFFLISEDNVRRQILLPWVSFGSDAHALGNDGLFLESSTHPRAFGNFARLYARYVRNEKRLSIAEAVHRMTGLPAANLGIARRGLLREGYFADLVVFDSDQIQDHATFEDPNQYATGVSEVFVNGVEVICKGVHTGAKPGRVVRRSR